MKIGKREKILLIVFGLLLYVLVFVKFILIPVLPQIKDINKEISVVSKQKDALDNDFKNIETKKLELQAKTLNNEKLKAYLLENANTTDGIEYIDKLSQMLGKVDSLSIGAPAEKVLADGVSKYYEMNLSFNTELNFEDSVGLLKYLESSNLKVMVSQFSMKPIGTNDISALAAIEPQTDNKNTSKAIKQSANPNNATKNVKAPMFSISITINLYSLSANYTDKLFEYSRNKFNSYDNKNGVLFSPEIEKATAGTQVQTTTNTDAANPDVTINEGSFAASGPNLKIFGTANGNDFIEVKTNKLQNITLTLDGGGYTIKTLSESGKMLTLNVPLPQNDAKLALNINTPDIPENKNIRLNIKIINNSTKRLIISLNDKEKRAKITDRSGSVIYGNSTSEKVSIS